MIFFLKINLYRKAGKIVSRSQACIIFGEYEISCKKIHIQKKDRKQLWMVFQMGL
jgi:hypothetical protein